LQAQIEPHFLFNTLANVVSLMERDTATAKSMLESFVDYLRASLSGLSRDRHTLADEMRLVQAYLAIARLRMASRLAVTFDVPPSLLALRLPALTLQPLVENAIVHGLEPQIAGGHIAVSGRREGDRLVLTVRDDGRGLPTGSAAAIPAAGDAGQAGAGTAIANIRERLARAHPGGASLTLEAVQPHGVQAHLSLPIAASDAG
jgi:sensor histidine kinase YesM